MKIPPLKYFFSPKRWRMYIAWLLKLAAYRLEGSKTQRDYIPRHELLQLTYKVAQCHECVLAGNCINCTCDAIGLINSPVAECKHGDWGIELTKEEFDHYTKLFKHILTNTKLRK